MQNNYQQQAKKEEGATLILEEKFKLYLGDLDDAQNKQWLKKHKIGCVITVANGQPISYYDNKIIHHYYFIDDKADFKIQKYFSKIFHDIEREIQTTNILIHCAAGISRSAIVNKKLLMIINNKQSLEFIINIKQTILLLLHIQL